METINNQRVIKKYKNRKLYDPVLSEYISNDDILQMVRSNTEFKVIQNETNENVTKTVLLSALKSLTDISENEIIAFINKH